MPSARSRWRVEAAALGDADRLGGGDGAGGARRGQPWSCTESAGPSAARLRVAAGPWARPVPPFPLSHFDSPPSNTTPLSPHPIHTHRGWQSLAAANAPRAPVPASLVPPGICVLGGDAVHPARTRLRTLLYRHE